MSIRKSAVVFGGSGFIGHHLARMLKEKGYFVRCVDIKPYEYGDTSSFCDEFGLLDLRNPHDCAKALDAWEPYSPYYPFNEVYNLAANMGGMGHIHSAEYDIMHDNVLINTNVVNAVRKFQIERYFFSSSVCVYRDMKIGELELSEKDAYPAQPDNEYGYEKLYAERFAFTMARHSNTTVRIARFQNCYGPEGTWDGGKEKAPAAICRKIAMLPEKGGTIDIWGDGTAVRSYIYVLSLIDGIYKLMHSDINTPTNIGSRTYINVKELVDIVAKIANKKVDIRTVPGPIGVESRNFSNDLIESTGWNDSWTIEHGLAQTYTWIEEQVKEREEREKYLTK